MLRLALDLHNGQRSGRRAFWLLSTVPCVQVFAMAQQQIFAWHNSRAARRPW